MGVLGAQSFECSEVYLDCVGLCGTVQDGVGWCGTVQDGVATHGKAALTVCHLYLYDLELLF